MTEKMHQVDELFTEMNERYRNAAYF
jgi:hypothetical protein